MGGCGDTGGTYVVAVRYTQNKKFVTRFPDRVYIFLFGSTRRDYPDQSKHYCINSIWCHNIRVEFGKDTKMKKTITQKYKAGSKMLFADGSFNVALATKKKSSLKNLQNLGIAKIAEASVYKPTEKTKPTATKGKGKTAKVVKKKMTELTTIAINTLTEMIQHEEQIEHHGMKQIELRVSQLKKKAEIEPTLITKIAGKKS
jgi:hypothetical protein